MLKGNNVGAYSIRPINSNGVTLVALIITIIVLLILAAISFSVLLGDNGLLTRAKDAADLWREAEANEANGLNGLLGEIDDWTKGHSVVTYGSPYQYQILNSYLIPEIEQKLGRRYETTDIFYQVDNIASNIDSQNEYIYNKKEKILIEVDKTRLKRRKALWIWSDIDIYMANKSMSINDLDIIQNEGFTDLFVAFGEENIEADLYKEFVRDAYERGFNIEYLTGDPIYIAPHKHKSHIDTKIDLISDKNRNSQYNEKITGIHYDVEPHTSGIIKFEDNTDMNAWVKSNSTVNMENQRRVYLLQFVERAKKYKDNNNKEITLAFDVPPSYTNYKVIYNGKEVNLMEEIAKSSDYISLMSYNDNVVKLYMDIAAPSVLSYERYTEKYRRIK